MRVRLVIHQACTLGYLGIKRGCFDHGARASPGHPYCESTGGSKRSPINRTLESQRFQKQGFEPRARAPPHATSRKNGAHFLCHVYKNASWRCIAHVWVSCDFYVPREGYMLASVSPG